MIKKLIKEFEQKPSQDIYNLLNILNLTPICLIQNGFYKLNIRERNLTKKKNYSHSVNLAYKYYQIKSLKEKKVKIARHFAIRRILNKHYSVWSRMNIKKSL